MTGVKYFYKYISLKWAPLTSYYGQLKGLFIGGVNLAKNIKI